MQTLAAQIAFTFVDDAMALMTGVARIVVRVLMSPIERLANACDVAGVLAARRAARLLEADVAGFRPAGLVGQPVRLMSPGPSRGRLSFERLLTRFTVDVRDRASVARRKS